MANNGATKNWRVLLEILSEEQRERLIEQAHRDAAAFRKGGERHEQFLHRREASLKVWAKRKAARAAGGQKQ